MGRFFEEIFRGDEGTRTYKVHVPESAKDARSMPLIVMLHGCTQSPDDFAAGTCMNALSEQHLCVIVYPAQSAAANPMRCWNWFKVGDQQRDLGEPAIIAAITRKVMRAYPIDERRVFIAGLSAGASMAVIVAATYPELYAAIGAHSGLPYGSATNAMEAFSAMRNGPAVTRNLPTIGMPVIIFQGSDDQIVNLRNGEQIIAQWLRSRQDQTTLREESTGDANGRAYSRQEYRDSRGELIAEHWVVEHLGHAWSGGSPAGSYTDPAGPHASEEMLRFFQLASTPRQAGRIGRLVRSIRRYVASGVARPT